mgnify:CR=1 FL=1
MDWSVLSLGGVSRLLLTPPSESTDQSIRMAQDCLNSLRRKRAQEKLKALMLTINSLSGEEKMAAMTEVQTLNAYLNRLKSAKG